MMLTTITRNVSVTHVIVAAAVVVALLKYTDMELPGSSESGEEDA